MKKLIPLLLLTVFNLLIFGSPAFADKIYLMWADKDCECLAPSAKKCTCWYKPDPKPNPTEKRGKPQVNPNSMELDVDMNFNQKGGTVTVHWKAVGNELKDQMPVNVSAELTYRVNKTTVCKIAPQMLVMVKKGENFSMTAKATFMKGEVSRMDFR